MQIAENTFVLNDEGVAEVSNATGDDSDTIQEAIDSCPVEAISWGE
jgi:ferredoxin